MQTLAAIHHHLPIPYLAAITSDYICPLDASFVKAAQHGHYELVTNHIAAGRVDWNHGLERACMNGYDHIVTLMIGRISRVCCFWSRAEKRATDWNRGLHAACRGGRLTLARRMIAHGATDMNEGLYYACQGGHHDLVAHMIARGARNWDNGLRGACAGSHHELIGYMIARGASNWNAGLRGACDGGHLDIAKDMITRGADNWNSALLGATGGPHHYPDLITLLIDRGATDIRLAIQLSGNLETTALLQLYI
jgi:hypothetical protein